MHAANNRIEQARRAHRPPVVRTLFVGESPPASGKFFYCDDTDLFRCTRQAFSDVYGPFADRAQFLATFQERGCYLVDLCASSVNHLAKPAQRAAHRAAIPAFVAVLRDLQPHRIVVVMKAIEQTVRCAVDAASMKGVPLTVLPFPAHGHQPPYASGLVEFLAHEGI